MRKEDRRAYRAPSGNGGHVAGGIWIPVRSVPAAERPRHLPLLSPAPVHRNLPDRRACRRGPTAAWKFTRTAAFPAARASSPAYEFTNITWRRRAAAES